MSSFDLARRSPRRTWRGRATLLAAMLALAACGDSPTDGGKPPAEPTVEARVLWLSRYDYSSQSGLLALIDSAAKANFNIIYFQARGNGDALYQPGLEPWYRGLTGTLGADPGWDPLQTAITRAHAQGIELHAWMNTTPAWTTSYTLTESTPRHALLAHPEWGMRDTAGTQLLTDGSSQLFSPGAAGYRTHVARVAADVLRRYPALDGIHLDYIRYPYATPSYYDKASWDAWSAAGKPGSFDDFRRAAVTDIVQQVFDSMKAVRPSARLSAATWGVYRLTGTAAGWTGVAAGYDSRLQDSRDWAVHGIIDALAPMVYWPIAATYGQRLDFAYLADEHVAAVPNRHTYVGLDIENDVTGAMMIQQIKRTRAAHAAGVAVFSAQLLQTNHLWHLLPEQVFTHKATVPAMGWK